MKNPLGMLLLTLIFCHGAGAQTSEFTYQGKLNVGPAPGTAANTPHDFEFRLCAAVDSCTPPLEVKQRLAVEVTNGVFTVRLDFDEAQFNGADRWLEISVRPAGGSTFTPLLPRQRVTSAPYSIRSFNSTQLGGVAAGQYVMTSDPRMTDARDPIEGSTNYIQNRTTPQPSTSFNISGSGNIGGALRIEASGFPLPNTPSLSLSSNGIFQIDAPFQPSGRFVVLENGNVGIGNGAPTEKLQVAGNVSVSGTLTGNGANLTNLNAGNITNGILSISRGGTGNATQNFVDLSTNQTIGGWKAFSGLLSAAKIGIGTTPSFYKLEVIDTSNLGLRVQTNTTGGTVASFGGNGAFEVDGSFAGERLFISEAGSISMGPLFSPDYRLTVSGNAIKTVGGGSWAVFSDERLKNINGRFTRGLADLIRLNPIRFEYKPDNALGLRGVGEYIGFSAQEVERVVPEAVTRGTNGYLQINNDPILWTMLNSVKEQQEQIEAQKNKIDALTTLVCELKPNAAFCREDKR